MDDIVAFPRKKVKERKIVKKNLDTHQIVKSARASEKNLVMLESDKIDLGAPRRLINLFKPLIHDGDELSGTKSKHIAREMEHVNKNIQALCVMFEVLKISLTCIGPA